ncbi:MAG: hypothetical protein R6W96_01205 [Clostridia bacterium]
MFEMKPDYEKCMERINAFWANDLADRPLVWMGYQKPDPKPLIEKKYNNLRERWLDFDTRVENYVIQMENSVAYADAMPMAWPNMGPEIISAMCGCGYEFGETTAWSTPCVRDWQDDYDKSVFSQDNEYFKLLDTFTRKLAEAGKGRFIVGYTDMHGGGDHLAALRDPQELCIDMIENVGWIRKKLTDSYREFYWIYEHFHEMLSGMGMPSTTWLPLVCEKGKYAVVSNDFSCMISKKMFDDMFLPGIAEECAYFDRSIYHLDGPGALVHLDSLLQIKELDAIQWVPGAGNEGFHRWIGVYKKIQKASKGIQVLVQPGELGEVFEHLDPEGVMLCVQGIENESQAENVMKKIKKWR